MICHFIEKKCLKINVFYHSTGICWAIFSAKDFAISGDFASTMTLSTGSVPEALTKTRPFDPKS
jgi:hypothetical protein